MPTTRSLVLGGGEQGDRVLGGMGRTLLGGMWSLFLKQKVAMLVGFVKPEVLQSLAQLLEQPGITPAVDRTFQLENAADGMRPLIASRVHGKLVLRVSA